MHRHLWTYIIIIIQMVMGQPATPALSTEETTTTMTIQLATQNMTIIPEVTTEVTPWKNATNNFVKPSQGPMSNTTSKDIGFPILLSSELLYNAVQSLSNVTIFQNLLNYSLPPEPILPPKYDIYGKFQGKLMPLKFNYQNSLSFCARQHLKLLAPLNGADFHKMKQFNQSLWVDVHIQNKETDDYLYGSGYAVPHIFTAPLNKTDKRELTFELSDSKCNLFSFSLPKLATVACTEEHYFICGRETDFPQKLSEYTKQKAKNTFVFKTYIKLRQKLLINNKIWQTFVQKLPIADCFSHTNVSFPDPIPSGLEHPLLKTQMIISQIPRIISIMRNAIKVSQFHGVKSFRTEKKSLCITHPTPLYSKASDHLGGINVPLIIDIVLAILTFLLLALGVLNASRVFYPNLFRTNNNELQVAYVARSHSRPGSPRSTISPRRVRFRCPRPGPGSDASTSSSETLERRYLNLV